VREIEVLSADECDRIHHRVHALRSQWKKRRPNLPFYTLGAASYLDAPDNNFSDYQQQAMALNPILKEHFSGLYDQVATRLSEELGEPARYEEALISTPPGRSAPNARALPPHQPSDRFLFISATISLATVMSFSWRAPRLRTTPFSSST
jgi:hypothetical protein